MLVQIVGVVVAGVISLGRCRGRSSSKQPERLALNLKRGRMNVILLWCGFWWTATAIEYVINLQGFVEVCQRHGKPITPGGLAFIGLIVIALGPVRTPFRWLIKGFNGVGRSDKENGPGN